MIWNQSLSRGRWAPRSSLTTLTPPATYSTKILIRRESPTKTCQCPPYPTRRPSNDQPNRTLINLLQSTSRWKTYFSYMRRTLWSPITNQDKNSNSPRLGSRALCLPRVTTNTSNSSKRKTDMTKSSRITLNIDRKLLHSTADLCIAGTTR